MYDYIVTYLYKPIEYSARVVRVQSYRMHEFEPHVLIGGRVGILYREWFCWIYIPWQPWLTVILNGCTMHFHLNTYGTANNLHWNADPR